MREGEGDLSLEINSMLINLKDNDEMTILHINVNT